MKVKYGECWNFATDKCKKEVKRIAVLLEEAYNAENINRGNTANLLCEKCKNYALEQEVPNMHISTGKIRFD